MITHPLFVRAKEARREGRPQEALELLESFEAQYFPTSETVTLKAMLAMELGDFAAADSHLDTLLFQKIDRIDNYVGKAHICRERGQLDEAMEYAKKAEKTAQEYLSAVHGMKADIIQRKNRKP